MAGKPKAQKPKPKPRPAVGGSFTLDRETGEWIRTGEPPQAELPNPVPVTDSNNGLDS